MIDQKDADNLLKAMIVKAEKDIQSQGDTRDTHIRELECELLRARTQNIFHLKGVHGAIEYLQLLNTTEAHLIQTRDELLPKLEALRDDVVERLKVFYDDTL